MDSSLFASRLAEAIQTRTLLTPRESVVVGVSGGGDSIALLHGLTEAARSTGAEWRLHVAHLNHRLRGEESDGDAAFVRRQAERLGLSCTVETRDVRAEADRGSGLEEAARRCRYAFFRRVAERTGSTAVALAHHADDNAETVLHRIARGTGLRGLSGIPARRKLAADCEIHVVRPLLDFRREELHRFLVDRGIPFRSDSSNDCPDFTRNRIRSNVLPLLREQVHASADQALLRLAEQARWAQSFIAQAATPVFARVVVAHDDKELSLDAAALSAQPPALQAELIRRAYLSFGLGERDLTFDHLVGVMELAGRGRSGKRLHLPHGLTVSREYERLRFHRPDAEAHAGRDQEVMVPLGREVIVPAYRLTIQSKVEEPDSLDQKLTHWVQHKTPGQEWLDHDRLDPPLLVRSRRAGDRFTPLGAPGSKLIADLLAEVKVRASRRDDVPVLCDNQGPIWVVPYRIADRVKVTPQTRRVLKLTANTWQGYAADSAGA